MEYVSTIEHQRLPFFGTQWHPEKPPFEFSDNTIPHSHEAIAVSQHLRCRTSAACAWSCLPSASLQRILITRIFERIRCTMRALLCPYCRVSFA